MKFEEKNRMSRRGLARFFKGLSELVEKDELEVAAGRISLGESVDVEVEYKEKKGKAKLEIELKWQISGGDETMKGSGEKEMVSDRSGESISEVKQEMKKSFNALRKTIEGSELPSLPAVEALVDINDRCRALAEGEGYESELEAFTELVNRFREAVKSGNLDEAKTLVGEMRSAKKTCHKTYRWKEE
ncbi:MAG TPA: GAK system XXXCH domain-containing protein [Euryarchaeota archaeon]|nr:cytochrome b562 [archaeon BMS3Bbin16]HDH28135.1 GAK system XXXCH domain-containing protein [Euryarchaeota archaeon]